MLASQNGGKRRKHTVQKEEHSRTSEAVNNWNRLTMLTYFSGSCGSTRCQMSVSWKAMAITDSLYPFVCVFIHWKREREGGLSVWGDERKSRIELVFPQVSLTHTHTHRHTKKWWRRRRRKGVQLQVKIQEKNSFLHVYFSFCVCVCVCAE